MAVAAPGRRGGRHQRTKTKRIDARWDFQGEPRPRSIPPLPPRCGPCVGDAIISDADFSNPLTRNRSGDERRR